MLRIFLLIGVFWLVLKIIVSSATSQSVEKRPNFVFMLTDDQDKVLHSLESMPYLKNLLSKHGTTFENAFVSTPICCPSRSQILTGRYGHNNGAVNNSVSGECSSPHWQQTQEPKTFPKLLQDSGYRTMYAGKYLNQYGYPDTGGAEHVPVGWDWWAGLIDKHGTNYYYNYNMSVNGTFIHHGNQYKDYLTNVIQDHAMDFLSNVQDDTNPFFMMLCPTAPHDPYSFLPQFKGNFTGRIAPRTPSYNHHSEDKHWVVRVKPTKLPQKLLDWVDSIFRNRWRALQSVDALVKNIVEELEKKGMLENTIFVYSADNGFQLGQFCLPYDKRQPYEFDIRVPMVVSGPGVKKGVTRYEPVVSIDIAPTILEMAGIQLTQAPWLDGRSMKQLVTGNEPNFESNWRSKFLVEYWGEGPRPSDVELAPGRQATSNATIIASKLPDWVLPGYLNNIDDQSTVECGDTDPMNSCMALDAWNNTYSCLRRLTSDKDEIYCEFVDNENFREYFDLKKDPWELTNAYHQLKPGKVAELHKELKLLKQCQGANCRIYDHTRDE